MKTVVDAVNVLIGDIELGVAAVCYGRILDFVVSTSFSPREDNFDVKFLDGTSAQFSCDEFNQCVAEMTEGLFVPLSDLNKRKASCGEQKTVELDGMVYEIGGLYIGACNQLVRLDRISDGYFIGVDTSGNPYRNQWLISVSESSTFPESKLGTITKAPLVLKDGTLVMFDCGNSTGNIGEVYTSLTNLKMIDFVQNNRFVEADKCTNIVKLVPESK